MKPEIKKQIILHLPYLAFVYLFGKVGQAFRLAQGADLSAKLLHIGQGFSAAFASAAPSFHPTDLLIGLAAAVIIRLVVYSKQKNAKKYRKGMEYGTARWGTAADIKPFIDPVFDNNVLLTATERLMMSNRPKDPKNARNKNILVIGGSGSGKTRFFCKPNIMQLHSSYVITDPKGSLICEVGQLLQRAKYRIAVLNTINFSKSMHYNPFAYLRTEKDILKLVNTIIVNTKGEGAQSTEDFWVKAERLYYTALIGYIHYEAPEEEKNFITLLDMINASDTREDDEDYKNPVDLLFDRLEEREPEHFAVKQYRKYKLAAGVVCSKRLLNQAVEKSLRTHNLKSKKGAQAMRKNEKITALYERLSRDDFGKDDDQQRESNSISNQKAMLEEFAARQGFTNIVHFTDDGISGTCFDRPGFLAMMKEVEAGNVEYLCIKDMSRMGRDYLKVGQIMEILRQRGVRLIAINDGVDSARGDDDFTPFRNIMNEYYARDTSRKIRSTFQSKGKSGKHLTGTVIYGYLWNEARDQWLVDPEAAEVVKRIFAMTIDGYGPYQIASKLKEEKVLIPSAYLARHGEGVNKNKTFKDVYGWGSSTICNILEKREYLGHTINFKTRKHFKDKKSHYVPEDEWTIFENTHEAIIDQQTFDLVQKIRGNVRRYPDGWGEAAPLTGLLYCADCGGKMYVHRTNNGKRISQYTCSQYSKVPVGKLCTTQHRINEDVVLSLVSEMLKAILLVLIIYTIWGNSALMVSMVNISSDRIASAFSNFRIAQVSDLHNAEFGKSNTELIELLSEHEPDIIVITGDLIDAGHTDIEIAFDFIKQAVQIAPVYFVTGNHEANFSHYDQFKTGLEASGVTVLEDEAIQLVHNNEMITLIGLSDSDFTIKGDMFNEAPAMVNTKLNSLIDDENSYTILLSHRPELFETYVCCGVDLVLCGHAHGGQFRLPFIGGLVAPNQGLFPKYDSGLYTDGKTNMVVSRGLGNSIIPFRFNNRPEVVLVELNTE